MAITGLTDKEILAGVDGMVSRGRDIAAAEALTKLTTRIDSGIKPEVFDAIAISTSSLSKLAGTGIAGAGSHSSHHMPSISTAAHTGGLVSDEDFFQLSKSAMPEDVLESIDFLSGKGLDPELTKRLRDTIEGFKLKLKGEHSVTEEKKDPSIEALEEISTLLTNEWSAVSQSFSLRTPTSLTVVKSDDSFSKVPGIGGEDFKPVRAYIGKKGAIICVFEPATVTERYTAMEMPYSDCLNNLQGFRESVVYFGAAGKLSVIGESKARIRAAQDLEKFSKTYEDFGAF
jgi:hypothetical protein